MKESKENIRRSKQLHSRFSNRTAAEHKANLPCTDSRTDMTVLGAEPSPLEVHL
jgi:hypothetical protein